MSGYSQPLFGGSSPRWPDTTGEPVCVRLVSAAYRIGAILDRASQFRTAQEAGIALTPAESHFLSLADRMLEIGLDAFIAEGKGTL